MPYSPYLTRAARTGVGLEMLRAAQQVRDQKIVDLYERGYNTTEIARMRGINLSVPGVRRSLYRAGVTLRAPGTRVQHKLTQAKLDAIRAASEQSQPTAEARPKAAPKKHPGGRPRSTVRQHAAEIARRYLAGESGNTLGTAYGVSSRTIYEILATQGVERRSKTSKTPAFFEAMARRAKSMADGADQSYKALKTRNAEIVRARVEDGLTYGELGEKFNLSRQRVQQILMRAGATAGGQHRLAASKRPARKASAVAAAPITLPATAEATTILRYIDRLADTIGVVQSAVVAIANDLGITINPDGTVERDQMPSVIAITRNLTHNDNGRAEASAGQYPAGDDTLAERTASLSEGFDGIVQAHGTGKLPEGWRYMTEPERLQAWAHRGGTPPANLVVRDESATLHH